jgi:hypothetical protein
MSNLEDKLSAAAVGIVLTIAVVVCSFALGYAEGASTPSRVVKLRSACELQDRSGLRAGWYELAVKP